MFEVHGMIFQQSCNGKLTRLAAHGPGTADSVRIAQRILPRINAEWPGQTKEWKLSRVDAREGYEALNKKTLLMS